MNTLDELRKRLDNVTDRSKVGWDLNRKIKLFPPETEARCPYCGEWFPTNRIWLVDDRSNYLMGCWLPDGRAIPPDEIVHPHVWMGGEVCLGGDSTSRCESASEALFAGIAKGRHVHYVPRWLYQLGHKCDQIMMLDCPICAEKFHTDIKVYFGYRNVRVCSDNCHEIAIRSRCEECCCQLDNKGQMRFCEKCAEKLYVACTVCSSKMFSDNIYYYSRKDLGCCYRCYSEELRLCKKCGFQERKEEINEEDLCEICMGNPLVLCDDCGMTFEADRLTDGRCDYCRDFCDGCECSPCECEYEEKEEIEI